mgnify:CR=1 FL=1
MFKEYLYNGTGKFKLSKQKTNDTSLCPDRAKAEQKMEKKFGIQLQQNILKII